MRRLSESVFDDIIVRSKGNDIRNEDRPILNNIDKLKCGVCIDDIYWADQQLKVNDEYEISINTFNCIKNYQLKGWRLPTRKEFEKLIKNTYIYSSNCYESKAFENPVKEGPFVDLYTLELMQIQKDNEFNIANYDEFGKIRFYSIDENVNTFKNCIIVVQLVRDNKI